jgi:DNA-binding XRE family transcriptional regulator
MSEINHLAAAPYLAKIAGLIVSRRRELNLRQIDVANTLGIGKRTMIRLEAGDPGISIGTVLAVIRALELDVDLSPAKPSVRFRPKRQD